MKKRRGTYADGAYALARGVSVKKDWKKNKLIYLMFVPIAVYLIVFHYVPMTGVLMAFEKYSVKKGWFHSPWVGWANFEQLFSGSAFVTAFRNTACIAVLNLLFSFVPPIALAIIYSECRMKKLRRAAQLISYIPNFISAVVVCSLVKQFVGRDGPATMLLSTLLGWENKNWLADPNIPVFWVIYALMSTWMSMGWGSIIYSAAIANINGDLREAAALDGANRWQRVWYIVVPSLLPLCMMQLTMAVGIMFMAGWDKVLLLYMPTTYQVSDVLYTYTYRMAFGSQINYGLSTASGLFQSVIGTVLLIVTNKINTKATGHALY